MRRNDWVFDEPPPTLITPLCYVLYFAACLRRTLELDRVCCLRCDGGITLLVETFASSALPRAWSAVICGEFIAVHNVVVLMSESAFDLESPVGS